MDNLKALKRNCRIFVEHCGNKLKEHEDSVKNKISVLNADNPKVIFQLSFFHLARLLIILYAYHNKFLSPKARKMVSTLISSTNLCDKTDQDKQPQAIFESVGKDLHRNPLLVHDAFSLENNYALDYELNYSELTELAELVILSRSNRSDSVYFDYSKFKFNFIGDVYESLLRYEPVFENHQFTLTKTKKSPGKISGSFFTPYEIIEYIVKHTIRPAIKCMNSSDILNLRVLDPAMGAGHFLNHAIEMIADKYLKLDKSHDKSKALKLTAQNCIYGIDKDPVAVELAKIGVIFQVKPSDALTRSLDNNLKCGDTLIGSDFQPHDVYQSKLHWEADFKDVLRKGFDIIIGNPPWITLRHSEVSSDILNYFKSRYRSAAGFKLNTFPLFIEKSIELLSEKGRLGLIVPNRILDTPSYSESRRVLFDSITIDGIVSIPSGFFSKVTAGNVIITGTKDRNNSKRTLKIRKFKATQNEEVITVPWEHIKKDNLLRVNIYINPAFIPIAGRMGKNSVPFSSLFDLHVGMMIKNRDSVLVNEIDCDNNQPVITSRDIGICGIHKKRFFAPSKITIFGGTKDRRKHRTFPKIVIRKTGDRILAAIDTEGLFCEQSLYMAIPKAEISLPHLKTICLLLNSKLISEYYRNMLITNPDSFPYIQHYDLSRIPLVEYIDNSTITEMVQLYDNLNSGKSEIEDVSDRLERVASVTFRL